MKKVLASTALVCTLLTSANAEIYTGTSFTVGTTNHGYHTRLDQYVGHSDLPWVYGKIGIARESDPMGDDFTYSNASELDIDVTSLVVGIGFNVLNYKNYFIDISADYYLALDAEDKKGTILNESGGGSDVITNTMELNTPAFELGIGYSFDNWSVRADCVVPLVQYEHEILVPGGGTHTEESSRVSFGFGVTYWWE